MPKGEITKRYHWCVEEYSTHEKKDEDFVDRFYFTCVDKILKKYDCPRMNFYYYLKNNGRSKKLGHLKILRIDIPRKVEYDNPAII